MIFFAAVFYVSFWTFMAPFGLALYPFTAALVYWYYLVDSRYND